MSTVIDPRKIGTFKDLGIKSLRLPLSFKEPLNIQKKMLAVNKCGFNAFVESPPKQGKTTAAIMSLLCTPSVPPPQLTNLVLVPTPSLADQWKETALQLAPADAKPFEVLYRTGSVENDEQQHAQLKQSQQNGSLHTLVATPQRVLDYISADPSFLQLHGISQLVVDELDLFAHSNVEKKTPLEVLLGHLYSWRRLQKRPDPVIQLLMNRRRSFAELPYILNGEKRLYEIQGDPPTWSGEFQTENKGSISDLQGCVHVLKRTYKGAGLVVAPPRMSVLKLQQALDADPKLAGLTTVRPDEVAGINIDGVANVYILGDHGPDSVERLKWLVTPGGRVVHHP